ncbi:MAG: nucleoside hydrolase [Thermoguttaceae bacterium]|nr:nucleoside hydrolase [Thermoguttaceae bacterium]
MRSVAPMTLIVLVALPLLALAVMAAEGKSATPVILDTDIGDDIDDTWALTLLLKSPELDLKLVVSDYGDTEYRAKILAKMLEVAKRTDVAVGIGIRQNSHGGRQAPWVKDYDLSRYPGKVHRDGVGALIRTIMESAEPITLICIGPLPNIKAALEREPRIAEKARFIGMHGSVRKGYGGKATPDPEWNVRADPVACRKVFTAPWPMTITPLDTCGLVRLTGTKYAKVARCNDPLVRALMENYRYWRKAQDKNAPDEADASSILFDTVAVYLATSHHLVNIERIPLVVTDKGFTAIDPKGKPVDCAISWKDLPAYEDWLVGRLTH